MLFYSAGLEINYISNPINKYVGVFIELLCEVMYLVSNETKNEIKAINIFWIPAFAGMTDPY